MIKFDQVTKVYSGAIYALKNVSFQVGQGEIVFLAGHSGAGKSTILNLIAGIETASSGKVFLNKQDLGKLSDNQLGYMRQHIGIVFQDHKLLFDRNVMQNVLLPLQVIGFEHQEANKRALAAIDKVGLAGKETAMPIALSGGEQQRLCIARAVVHKPSLLIADEPSANLDRAYALDIMELFKSFHQVGVTVLISAHDETLMSDYGHRILRLREGQFAS